LADKGLGFQEGDGFLERDTVLYHGEFGKILHDIR
jgi:hypothetical protein